MLDLLIANARLVDLDDGTESFRDIHVKDGRIAELGTGGAAARRVVDAAGALVIPGLVDTHVHLTPEISGQYGFRLLARAGVTTALDMAGPESDLRRDVPRYGVGLRLHSLESLRPGVNIPDSDPDRDTLVRFAKAATERGCFGIKILGGHYPMTPGATRRAIEVANDLGIHVAMHSGTTETGSNIVGFRETVELAGDLFLHIAHINSYCRGNHRHPAHEALEALALLDGRANFVTESYLSGYNAARADLDENGEFNTNVMRNTLVQVGYSPDMDGLEKAVCDGVAMVNAGRGEDLALITGPEAWAEWQTLEHKPRFCFPVNNFQAQAYLATARDAEGDFIVTALATDGGGIPRNETLSAGLGLVEAGLLPLVDFIRKACRTPARRLLRRDDVGDIAPGQRADLVVLDEGRRAAATVIYDGEIILEADTVRSCGRSELNGRPIALTS